MKGYYSLIQYCPDLSRAEAANVGVLLFCPIAGFIQAKTSAGNDRVRRFFKEYSIDLERLNAVKESVEGRLRSYAKDFKSLEDLEKFIATRANEILITPPRPIKVANPEDELQALFSELVGGRQHRKRMDDTVTSELNRVFREPRFRDRIEFSKRILLPVVEREIEVPIAYRNGTLNLVQTATLSTIASRATNTALQFGGEARLVQNHPIDGQKASLIVVYGFGHARPDDDTAARVKNLFKDFDIRGIPQGEIEAFADDVSREAHS